MKQITLLLSILIINTITIAQNINISISDFSKDFSTSQALSSQIIDETNNKLYVLTNKRKKQPTHNQYQLSDYMIMTIDTNFNILSNIILKDTKKAEILATSTNEKNLSILMRENQNNADIITCWKISKKSLTLQNKLTIDTIYYSHKENLFLWCRSSPNAQYIAITYVIKNPNDENWTSRSTMFNNNMDSLWSIEPKTYAINDIFVTNDASLYIVGNHYFIESNKTNFYYEMLSKDKHCINTYSYNNILLNSYILNIVDSTMIIAGNIYSQSSPKNTITYGGMYGMSYNFNTKEHNLEIRELNHEDLCVLHNENITKIKILPFVDNLNVKHTIPSSNGGIITAQRESVKYKTTTNGDMNNIYTNTGILAMHVNKEGHITWAKPFRHKQEQINGIHYLNYILFTDKDKTYIIQSEDNQYSQTYNNNESIKSILPTLNKANTVLYCINSNGIVNKQTLLLNQKNSIYGYYNNWINNKYYYFIGNDNKCQLINLKQIITHNSNL